MNEDNMTKLQAAHISGRYQIASTLIASGFVLFIGFSLILHFEKPEREVIEKLVKVPYYDITLGTSLDSMIPRDRVITHHPSFAKYTQKVENIPYNAFSIDKEGYTFYCLLERYGHLKDSRVGIVRSADGESQEKILMIGETWELSGGVRLKLLGVTVTSLELFEIKVQFTKDS